MKNLHVKDGDRTLIFRPLKKTTPSGVVATLVGYLKGGKKFIYALLCGALLIFVTTASSCRNPQGQIGAQAGPTGTNLTGQIAWEVSSNVVVNVGGTVNPATGEWSSNLLITFRNLPDAETMQLASKAGAGTRTSKSAAVEYILCYDSTNRDHRLFIRAAQAKGALISGLK